MRTYEYACIPLNNAVGMSSMRPDEKGSYVSQDFESETYRDILRRGFRWVRTDGEWAIFEKSVLRFQRME